MIDVLNEKRVRDCGRQHADRLGGYWPAGQPLHCRTESIGAAIHQVIELEFSEKTTDRGAPLRHFSIAETRVLGLQEGAQPRRQRQIRCPFR